MPIIVLIERRLCFVLSWECNLFAIILCGEKMRNNNPSRSRSQEEKAQQHSEWNDCVFIIMARNHNHTTAENSLKSKEGPATTFKTWFRCFCRSMISHFWHCVRLSLAQNPLFSSSPLRIFICQIHYRHTFTRFLIPPQPKDLQFDYLNTHFYRRRAAQEQDEMRYSWCKMAGRMKN